MLSKTNNVTNTNGINLSSQKNQDYYNQHDLQLITHKHVGGWGYYNQNDQRFIASKQNGDPERVTNELVPNIILDEEEEESFASGLTIMLCGIITPTHLQKEMRWGAPTHLMLISEFSTLAKPNITVNWRQELWVRYPRHIASQIFTSANVSFRYWTFKTNY